MIFNSMTYVSELRKLYKYISFHNKNVLITGATGLIGSYLVDALCLKNKEENSLNKIYVLGRSQRKLKNRFDWHGKYQPFYIITDLMNDEFPNGYEFDYIVHAASNADPKSYSTFPVETILTNIKGAEHVLEYCKIHLSCKVLLTSTYEIYGKHSSDEYFEDDYGYLDPNNLRSGYPESKRVAELLFRSYYIEHNVQGIIARLPSVYGPTMLSTDNKAHAEFLRSGLNHKDIILKSEGSQRRTYCYVGDVASGILKILLDGVVGESYNISNPSSIVSIKEFAEIVADVTKVRVIHSEENEMNSKWKIPFQNIILNSEKLQNLGWNPEYNVLQGVIESLQIMSEFRL